MRTFRFGDVLRCILLNAPKEPNLACPREGLTSTGPLPNSTLWKETLANRDDRVTLAQWDGLRLGGLASARVRGGRRAWEIDRLFLTQEADRFSANGNGQHSPPSTVALELFDQVGQAAGALRAERIFLRLPAKSPIFLMARRAGFFPYFEEMLLEGTVSGSPRSGETKETDPADWQDLLTEDQYSLFQLYCAATPQMVRSAVGLTFDQWRDAQENRGNRRDLVAKEGGRVVSWLGLSKRRQVTGVDALVHPGDPSLLKALVARALAQEGVQRWLVPDYQEEVVTQLLESQFHEVARYSVMVKRVAVPVVNPGMATVEA